MTILQQGDTRFIDDEYKINYDAVVYRNVGDPDDIHWECVIQDGFAWGKGATRQDAIDNAQKHLNERVQSILAPTDQLKRLLNSDT